MSSTTDARVLVRDVRGADELRACQALQRHAWGITEEGYTLPVATMASAQKMGGLVLGAFQEELLVAFSFAFLGRLRGEVVLYSQLTAVDPRFQGLGLGRQLKLSQRERATEMGLGSICWTFDPLQAGNAGFNLGALGATTRTYEVDLFGSRSDALNAGLATDRLLAEWGTEGDPRPGRREPWPDALELLEALDGPGSQRAPERIAHEALEAERLHLEIPAHLTSLKQTSLELAREWQLAVREALQAAFGSGFTAVGFAAGARTRPRYLLARQHHLPSSAQQESLRAR